MGYKRDQTEVQSKLFGNKGGGLFNNKPYDFILKEEFRKDNLLDRKSVV